MEQPLAPNKNPPTPLPKDPTTNIKPTKKKIPTPQDLISHYTTQGLDTQEASIKVIEDLQNVLFSVISSNNRAKKDKISAEMSRKLEVVNTRLAVLDMKVDSKPGYLETFSIGVVSGVTLKGIETVWPHVVEGVSQIFSAVSSATKPPSPSGS